MTLPSTGGDLTATDPDGDSAVYGPAVLFQSGALTVHSEGTLGPTGSVTSTTDVDGYQDPAEDPADPGGDGPGPFLYENVASSCSASGAGASGSTEIIGGILETKYDPGTGEATVTETVPVNPAANYTREGTIDHLGDSYRIVFNEQTTAADGTLTVNAAHVYLLGPNAEGDVIIGQSVCGATVEPGEHFADLSVTAIQDSPDPVVPGGDVTYTVTVSNLSAEPASGVALLATIDGPGSRLVSSTASGPDDSCTELKGRVKGAGCNLDAIAAGGTETVTIVVGAPHKTGPMSLTATVSSTSTDTDTTNNSRTESTNVERP